MHRSSIECTPTGLRDVAARLPVTTLTLFEAASLSKPVFAYAVLRLVAQGTLELDRALDSYLPAPYPIGDPRGTAITARHVLSHTSGLPNWRHATNESLALAFAPGTKYLYSGEGYYFLQTVVEHVTGKPTAQLMRAVLDDLGMRDSSYVWRDADVSTCALPYDAAGKPLPHDTALLGHQLIVMGQARSMPLADWNTADVLSRAACGASERLPQYPGMQCPTLPGRCLRPCATMPGSCKRSLSSPAISCLLQSFD